MLAEDRRNRILDQINVEGSVRTSALMRRFAVSDVTLRNDLHELEKRGRLIRTRGGAVRSAAGPGPSTVDTRAMKLPVIKSRIARAAADLVPSGQPIALDAGTTVGALSPYLPTGTIVVTPALDVAQQSLRRGLEVIVLAGHVDAESRSTTGPGKDDGTVPPVHTTFLGAYGVDPDMDVVDYSPRNAAGKNRLRRAGRRVVLLADATKWGIEGPAKVVATNEVDVVITDSGIAAVYAEAIRDSGVELIIV